MRAEETSFTDILEKAVYSQSKRFANRHRSQHLSSIPCVRKGNISFLKLPGR